MTMPVSLRGLIDAGPIVKFWAAAFCLLSNIWVRGPVQPGSRYPKCISRRRLSVPWLCQCRTVC